MNERDENFYVCPQLKYKYYSAGEWNSKIKTRLCTNCINIIRQQIDDAFEKHKNFVAEDTIKKRKETIDKTDLHRNEALTNNLLKQQNDTELKHSKSKLNKQKHFVSSDSTINATYLLLKNSYAVDCFLNAAVNAIDSMGILKDSICCRIDFIAPRRELIKILQRQILNVRDLRQSLPAYTSNEQEDAASALLKLIGLLDNHSKKLLQFSYDTYKKCQCEEIRICGAAQNCDALSLTVSDGSPDENTFNSMLNQWLSSKTNCCQTCKTNITINHFIKFVDKQKYLIVDINSWVNENGRIVQRSISSKDFNPDTQVIFGVPWMLICAIEYKGDSKQGHYLTWRRYVDKWIIISDDYYTFENQLINDLSHYKILVYAKTIDNLENEEFATFYPQENENHQNDERMLYEEPCKDNYNISTGNLKTNENLKNGNLEFPVLMSGIYQNPLTTNEDIIKYNTNRNLPTYPSFGNTNMIINENSHSGSVCDQTPMGEFYANSFYNQNTGNENTLAMEMDCGENNATNMLFSTFGGYFNDNDVNMLPIDETSAVEYQDYQPAYDLMQPFTTMQTRTTDNENGIVQNSTNNFYCENAFEHVIDWENLWREW